VDGRTEDRAIARHGDELDLVATQHLYDLACVSVAIEVGPKARALYVLDRDTGLLGDPLGSAWTVDDDHHDR
jgi:hypothetical protein